MQEIVGAVSLSAVAVVLLFFPRQVWKVTESWKNKRKTSPSKQYLVVIRCVSIVLLITAVAVILIEY